MCELEEHCAFFASAAGLNHAIEAVQSKLCKGDFKRCARYVVHESLGKHAVPEDLLPCDHIKAERLIQDSPDVGS